MKMKLLFAALAAVVCVNGCTRINKELNKHDRSKVYLQSDKFMAKRITVPGDLDSTKVEDYYTVPTIADQGDPKVPNLRPPHEQVAVKSITPPTSTPQGAA